MLLVDPMRRTILNLLADDAYTQSQIAQTVKLTDASVGHHLKILTNAKLIRIVRREEESHGIMQNFYRSVALCVVVDSERMSESVSKYFFPVNIERLRGALASLNHNDGQLKNINTHDIEKLAETFVYAIAREADKLGTRKVNSDRETITIKIYDRALHQMDKSLNSMRAKGK